MTVNPNKLLYKFLKRILGEQNVKRMAEKKIDDDSVMAIVNLVISIFLCQIYGAIGSAIGTAISLIFVNGIIMNIYYHNDTYRYFNADMVLCFQFQYGHGYGLDSLRNIYKNVPNVNKL